MRFIKQDLFSELEWFMEGFASSVGRMYGREIEAPLLRSPSANPLLPNWEELQATPLWSTLSAMFDYGVAARTVPDVADGSWTDVELFIRGLDGLSRYFEEDEHGLPKLSQQVVRIAAARHVLDDGGRYTSFDDESLDGYLSFAEVALLADMDERSVRNAANPKLPDPLQPETIGKRSVIPVVEARRWLAGRKGFLTTGSGDAEAQPIKFIPAANLLLPRELVNQIMSGAETAGVPVEEFIRRRISTPLDAAGQ